ncbi:hypothetical protein PYK79_48165 [Streptomyces sp. ID05-04B]|nr:hypothetical protein [Streptomyces sp. ID05-04B]
MGNPLCRKPYGGTSATAPSRRVISALLSARGVREARAQVEAAETQLGMELRAHQQPFQDRYDQAVRDSDSALLTGICPGKHGGWGRICVLDDGPEVSMEAPHWGLNSEGRPITWVGAHPTTGEVTQPPTDRSWGRCEVGGQDPGRVGRPGVLRCPGTAASRPRAYTHWSAMRWLWAGASHWCTCSPWDPVPLPRL